MNPKLNGNIKPSGSARVKANIPDLGSYVYFTRLPLGVSMTTLRHSPCAKAPSRLIDFFMCVIQNSFVICAPHAKKMLGQLVSQLSYWLIESYLSEPFQFRPCILFAQSGLHLPASRPRRFNYSGTK